MKLTFSNENFAIYDELLDDKQFQFLQKLIEQCEFFRINNSDWITVYKNLDGSPLESARFSSQKELNSKNTNKNLYVGLEEFQYALNHATENQCNLVGRRGIDWDFYTGRISLYPQGTRLSWHQDGPGRTGAYTYYVHQKWNVQWGGELLLAIHDELSEESMKWETLERKHQHFNNSLQNNVLLQTGMGYFVEPKPNRLIIFSSKVHHMINRVDISAGDQFRTSISGFFIKDKQNV